MHFYSQNGLNRTHQISRNASFHDEALWYI